MLHPPLTDQPYLKQLLAKAGIIPSRRAGQNFLISEEVVAATVVAAQAGPRQVTELGAGAGTLTAALLGAGCTVRAIERDTALAAILETQLAPQQRSALKLVPHDLQTVDWTWPTPYQVIGNIPYNLSGLIIRRLTQLDPPPTQVILLIQKEVGERLAAQPPDMHLISVAVQQWGSVHPILKVPAACFWPQPQVDSQLILLLPATNNIVPLHEREAVLALAKQLFQNRRKQLGPVLARLTGISLTQLAPQLEPLGIAPTQRPQELSVMQWQKLHKEIQRSKSKDQIKPKYQE